MIFYNWQHQPLTARLYLLAMVTLVMLLASLAAQAQMIQRGLP